MRKIINLIAAFSFPVIVVAQGAWTTNGNIGTKSAINFIGTKDTQDLVFKTNATEIGRIKQNSRSWKFGITGPDYSTIDKQGNLRFAGNATYRTGKNIYAIQDDTVVPGEGLYIDGNTNQWQFRDKNAFPFFNLNMLNHDVKLNGGLEVGSGANGIAIDAGGFMRFKGNATYKVGKNIYAIQDDSVIPGEGLYIDGGTNQWQFRDKNAFPFFNLNMLNHDVKLNGGLEVGSGANGIAIDAGGFMRFKGNATYKVGKNIYAIQDDSVIPGEGLYIDGGTSQWQFRDKNAFPFFNLNMLNHDVKLNGGLEVGSGANGIAIDAGGFMRFKGNATYKVGKNIYAIQDDTVIPGEGLYIDGITNQWQFRDKNANPFFMLNTQTQQLTSTGGMQVGVGPDFSKFDGKGNLRFVGDAAHLVSHNQFALLCDGEPLEGLYMNGNPNQWEFRDDDGVPFFILNVSTYDAVTKGGLKIGNSNTGVPGNIRFNGAEFQGYDGNKWKTFMLIEPTSAARTMAQSEKLTAENMNLQDQVNTLKTELEELKKVVMSLQPKNKQEIILSGDLLKQNTPNPFQNSTLINYTLPSQYSSAQILVTDKQGTVLKQIALTGKGKGSLNIRSYGLLAGTYQYSLLIDGKTIETRQMVLIN